MSRKHLIFAFIFLLIVLPVVGLFALKGRDLATVFDSKDHLKIAATIFPIYDIARNISGGDVEIELIIPPGVTEHSTSLTPKQLSGLQNTKAIFKVGHGLDDKLVDQITQDLPGTQVITVDRNIKLREFEIDEHEEEENVGEEEHDYDTGADPHYWLTIPNAKKIASQIENTLSEIDPAHKDDYKKNLNEYKAELDALEDELQAEANTVAPNKFIAMHNAWAYFADQYGLELVATYEPVEGREPSVADIQHLQEVIQQHGISVFFTEPQKQKSSAIRFLIDDLRLTVRVLDPLGGVDGRDSYIETMRENIEQLAEK